MRVGPSRSSAGPNPSRLATHEHEWRREPSLVEHDEHIYVVYPCTWAEVLSSRTSDRHDETFYEMGAECEARKKVTWEVHVEYDGHPVTPSVSAEVPYDEHPRLYEETIEERMDDLEAAAASVSPYDIPEELESMTVTHNDEDFLVTLVRDCVTVNPH